MKVAAVALAALLWASLPAGAQQAPHAQVAATAAADSLVLQVACEGAETVQLVLHHDDPIVGRIIDRVVEVPVEEGWVTNVTLRDLRPGLALNATILTAEEAIPVPASSQPPDPSLLEEAPTLAQERLPALPLLGGGSAHRFQGYPVSDNPMWSGPHRVLVTEEGIVAVGWIQNTPRAEPDMYDSLLTVAFSYDGGHTFPKAVEVSGNVSNAIDTWAWALDHSGQVHLVYSEWEFFPGYGEPVRPTRHVRVDPATANVTLREDFPDNTLLYYVSMAAVAGHLVVASSSYEPYPSPRGESVGVWLVGEDGGIEALPPLAASIQEMSPVYAASNGLGQVALLWKTPVDGGGSKLSLARSTDGGASFGPAQGILPPGGGHHFTLQWGFGLDAAGVAHVPALVAPPVQTVSRFPGPDDFDERAYYVRVPPAGEPTFRQVSGPDPDRLVPESRWADSLHLEIRGPRVWMYLIDYSPTGEGHGQLASFMMESFDGGLTFGRSFRTLTMSDMTLWNIGDLGTFPDGRPILAGQYSYDNRTAWVSVMPFFDPLPPVGSLLVTIEARAAPVASVVFEGIDGGTASDPPSDGPGPEDDGLEPAKPRDEPTPAPSAAALLALLAALAVARRRR